MLQVNRQCYACSQVATRSTFDVNILVFFNYPATTEIYTYLHLFPYTTLFRSTPPCQSRSARPPSQVRAKVPKRQAPSGAWAASAPARYGTVPYVLLRACRRSPRLAFRLSPVPCGSPAHPRATIRRSAEHTSEL